MSSFANTMSVPPGGEWFWEDKDVFIHSQSYSDTLDAIRRHFREKGIDKDPAVALAEYMCPRMPRGFCVGLMAGVKQEKTVADHLRATETECRGKQVEDTFTVQKRIEACESCEMCRHPLCVTCRGVDKAIYEMLDGRRSPLAIDAKSGVCSCDGTFVMGVASVKPEGKALEGAPDSCWRKKK